MLRFEVLYVTPDTIIDFRYDDDLTCEALLVLVRVISSFMLM